MTTYADVAAPHHPERRKTTMKTNSLYAIGVLAACAAHVLMGRELANGAHLVRVHIVDRDPASVRESAHDG
jgi:saccharopine dehydrogenase-like NADP-dependent oxidoreductase